MFSPLWALIVRGIIGIIAGATLGKDVPGGVIGNIIVGFLGSWVASLLLPSLGSATDGFPIISALLGAITCIAIYSSIVNHKA